MKQYNNDTLKQLFEFKGDEECLSFPKEENQLEEFSSLSPDFIPSMKDYISFLKCTVKGGKDKDRVIE